MQIDLNVDMGESFGMYSLGDDEGFMPFISSANVACGFHAGDPCVMKKTVALAKNHAVSVGAHPGLPDLQGFGRRMMDLSLDELYCDLMYQIGALQAFVGAAGMRLHHVKPHGKLYGMAHMREEVAQTICRVIRDIDGDLFLYCMKKGFLGEIAAEFGIRTIFEVYSDLDYDRDGNLVITRQHEVHEPAAVAERVVGMLRDGTVTTTAGTKLAIEGSSVCVHSDSPNALAIVRAVREAIIGNGFAIASP
ncbi:MAG: LamB/YcsF family protein [Syntrophobacteraceae bacterium]